MASTFSQTLRLELIGDGDQSGIWGQTTNTNLGTLLEQAITGVVNITMVDANYTLTNFNGVSDEARNAVLVVGGTNNAVRDIIAPLVEKLYVVRNSTVGGYAVNIRGSSGSSVSVPNGATVWVYCDGTNFNAINTETVGNFEVNGNLTVTGNTNAVAATYTGNVAALNISTANVAATGNVSATSFSGAGLTITSINASNISAGTISNARTTASSANGASTIITRDANGSFSANAGTFTSVSGNHSGDGSALSNLNASNLASGTVSSSRLSGTYSISVSGNAGTATSPQSGGSFITSSNIGSQSVNFATTAGTANALNSGITYTAGGLLVGGLPSFFGTAGGGGDVQLLFNTGNTIGEIAAVNLANSAYRWLKVGIGAPVLIGSTGPISSGNGYASLTLGTGNGNGAMWASSGYDPNQPGWAMVNGDGRMGSWLVGNGFLAVYVDGIQYGIPLQPSDERIKKNIVSSTYNATNTVNQIKFKAFDFDGEKTFRSDHIQCGLTSQQLQSVDPDLVREVGDLLQPDDSKLLMIALKGLQEANERIAKLEAKIAALEAK